MKNLFLILLFPIILLSQTNYYISSSGSDANDGLSIANPWLSLNKVYYTVNNPGDSILIKRGDTLEGAITKVLVGSAASPIVIGAYGTGELPILYGDLRGRTWTAIAGRTGYYKCYLGMYSTINTGYYQWVDNAWKGDSTGGTYSVYRGTNPATWESWLDQVPTGGYGITYEHDTMFVHLWNNATMPASRDSFRVYRYGNGPETGSKHVIVRDLDARNFYIPIVSTGSDSITIRKNKTRNGYSSCIRMITTNYSLVDSCEVDSSGDSGIYLVQSHKTTVQYNLVKNVLLTIDGGIAAGIDLCGIGILGNYAWGRAQDTVGYSVVQYNTIYSVYRAAFDFYYNLGDTVRHNVAHNVHGTGSPHGGGVVMTNNTITMDNILGGNGPNFSLLGGDFVYAHNFIDSVKDFGAWFTANIGDTIRYNNNFVRLNLTTGRSFADFKTTTLRIKADSNYYYQTGSNVWLKSGVSYTTIPTLFAATGLEEHSILNAAYIEITSGNNQSKVITQALTNPYVVTLRDANGNLSVGSTVTFAITDTPATATGHSLSDTVVTTDANGQASVTLTLGNKVGNYRVTVSSDSFTYSPVTFNSTATAAVATTIALVSGNNQSQIITLYAPDSLIVLVTDANENPVPNTSVAFAVTNVPPYSSSYFLSNVNATTDSRGYAVTRLQFGQHPGVYNITATATGLTGSPVTFTETARIDEQYFLFR